MNTITSEYRDLNRQLHEAGDYGGGSYRWSDTVMRIREETGSDTVLDYGCGQRQLFSALGEPAWLSNYDPAIDGLDVPPDTADLVVCTDVLEHVEPELLDNVLTHIADLAARAVFLVIPTTPARKFLADGRNAHLTVETPKWWRERLEKFFLITSWSVENHKIVMTGATIRAVGPIVAKSAVTDTIRSEQAVANCETVEFRVMPRERHNGRVAIVCYGPSLKQTWPMLRTERRAYGARIVTVSGAHDFLIERGIVPDVHIECDPREHKAFFTRNSHPEVDYWIASCCHPTMIEQLKERSLALWHVYNSDEDMRIIAPDGPDPGSTLIAGGGSVGCRAVNLMYTQGYRTFSIYGMDCSFGPDGEQHAGEHSGKVQHENMFRVGDRWFRSSGTLVYTARGFLQNLGVLSSVSRRNGEPDIEGIPQPVEVFLHGDGLLQSMATPVPGT